MEESSKQEPSKKKASDIKTFSVPFALEDIQENLIVSTNTPSQISQEEKINRAFQLQAQGNISEAAKYYQYFINQGLKDHRVFCNYGGILKVLGRLNEAELVTRKAIELNPDFAIAHANLGNILGNLGKLKEAELVTRKAIELNPEFPEAHSNLGTILKNLGNLQDAKNSYQQAIELNPGFPEAHSNLGTILKNLGNLQDAENSYRKAIKLNPHFAEAYSNLGSILELNNKLEEAKNSYRNAQVIKPDLDMDINFASLYLKEKDPKNALILINKILEKNPTDTVALAYKTIALRGVNKFDETNELINFPKLVKIIHSQNLIKEDILEFNKQFKNSLLIDPRRTTEENHTGWAIRGGTVIRELFTDRSNPLISQFHTMLSQAITNYIKDLPVNSEHPFLRRPIDSVSIDSCWVNFLEPGDFQANHIHNNGWLSGVYYLDEPKVEKHKSNAGWIEFNRSGYNLPHFGGEKGIKSIKPEVGMFIFFPSYVWHGTIPYNAAYTRGSISFDITIK